MLEQMAGMLQYISDLNCCDVFIDCLDRDNVAFVAAESKPRFYTSRYKGSVLGQSALRINEPAVYHAFERKVSIHDLKAMTQENLTVKQDATPVENRSGKVIGVMICERDVSKEASLERRLDLAERERQELFRQVIAGTPGKPSPAQSSIYACEAYHRIKNDLQMIASLCNVRIRQSAETETKQKLSEISQQVSAIASIYEILTVREGTKTSGTLPLDVLLGDVIQRVKDQAISTEGISISLACDEIMLRPERAKAVALVVLELVNNAIHHAFPDGTGTIRISIHSDLSRCSAVVEDNGVGFVEPSAGSKGLSIVSSLINDKLDGSFTIASSAGGTTATFYFLP